MTSATQPELLAVPVAARTVVMDLMAVVTSVQAMRGLGVGKDGCLPGCGFGNWTTADGPAGHSKRCMAARAAMEQAAEWLEAVG